MLADDVAWHTPGQNLVAGSFHGPDAVLDYLSRALELSADSMQIDVLDVPAGREHVAAVVRTTGETAAVWTTRASS